MPTCFVSGCSNTNRRKKTGVTFHSFPKKFKVQWLTAIKRDPNLLINYQRICSEHFYENDFEKIGALKKVKPNVIPSLKLPDKQFIPVKSGNSTPSNTLISTAKLNLSAILSVPLKITSESNNHDDKVSLMPASNTKSNLSTTLPDQLVFAPKIDSNILDDEESDNEKLEQNIVTREHCYSSVTRIPEHDHSSNTQSHDQDHPFDLQRFDHSYSLDASHNYRLDPEYYIKQLQLEKRKANYYKSKYLNTLKTSTRRKKKILILKKIVDELKKKSNETLNPLNALESTFEGIPLEIMKRMLANTKIKGKLVRSEYSEELKSFAMLLQLYSSKAYDLVRNTFDLALPAPSTIRS